MGRGLRAGRPGRARGAGLCLADGAVPAVLPGPRAVRKRAPFSRPQRAQLGQLVGGSPPPLRQRTAAPRHVPATKIFPTLSLVGIAVSILLSSPTHLLNPSPLSNEYPAVRCKHPFRTRERCDNLSSVPHWGRLVHPKDGHKKVFCVLHAYMDDSGTHDTSQICVVAGYFAGERTWILFDRSWRKVLTSEGLVEFHANRFWAQVSGAQTSEYKSWTRTRLNRLMSSLLAVLPSHRLYPVRSPAL